VGTEPVFTSTEPITEDRLRAALAEHGADRTVICGDQMVWLIASRIAGLATVHDFSDDVTNLDGSRLEADLTHVRVVEPSDLIKLDDSLGAGVWGLR
jgi:hypothetical protein